MEIVLPQGEIVNFKPIARASTGPQLDKLFIGGEGTLGIVTKATLKIWPYPEKRALISYAFPTFEDSLNATREILRNQVYPGVIRIYDKEETKRHFPDTKQAKDNVMVVLADSWPLRFSSNTVVADDTRFLKIWISTGLDTKSNAPAFSA